MQPDSRKHTGHTRSARALTPSRKEGIIRKGVRGDIALFSLGMLVIVGLLVWQGYSSLEDFKRQQSTLLERAAQAAHHQIALAIQERLKFSQLYTDDHLKEIQRLAHTQDPAQYQRFAQHLRQYFPDLRTFNITDNEGHLLLPNDQGMTGKTCQNDLKHYAKGGERAALRIHKDPRGYHLDLMNRFPGGVFFISVDPAPLANILRQNQPAGNALLLVRDSDDAQQRHLIEVSANGVRKALAGNDSGNVSGDDSLATQAWSQRIFDQAIPSTRWHLLALPSERAWTQKLHETLANNGWLLLILAIIGVVTMHLLRLVDRDRLAARHADQQKSEFLSTMSHEIRTPMNSIIGFSELLNHATLGARERSYVSGIREAGETLLAMINDVLDLSRIEAGHMEFEEASFDLKALCESTLNLFQPQALHKNLDLQLDFEASRPPEYRGDATRIRQILVNLIGNAIKFTDYGYVKIRVKETLHEDKSGVHIEVIDTGIGMSSEQAARVFDAFTQAEASTTRRYGGTGLGLAICKRLAELMGGKIGVDSRPGEGSRFWIELPLLPERRSQNLGVPAGMHERRHDDPNSPLDSPFVLKHERPGASGVPASVTTLAPARVLVVDDTPTNRLVLRGMLEEMGHQVITADNAKQAINKARKLAPDVVLMDCQMPDMDGADATRILRDGGFRQPIIGVSANALRADRQRCLDAGMDDYMVKPVGYSEVGNMIARHQPDKHQTKARETASDWQTRAGGDDHADFISHLGSMQATFPGDGLQRLLKAFKQEADGEMNAIHEAFAKADLDGLERNAHSLKGSSATIGAQALADACGELVNMVRGDHLGGADLVIADIQRLLESTRLAIDGWIRQTKAASTNQPDA